MQDLRSTTAEFPPNIYHLATGVARRVLVPNDALKFPVLKGVPVSKSMRTALHAHRDGGLRIDASPHLPVHYPYFGPERLSFPLFLDLFSAYPHFAGPSSSRLLLERCLA